MLESEFEGYRIFLRPVMVNGRRMTLLLDNFSITPLAILNYVLDELKLDTKEWSNVYSKPYICFKTIDLVGVSRYLKQEEYQSLKWIHRHYFI